MHFRERCSLDTVRWSVHLQGSLGVDIRAPAAFEQELAI